MPAQKIIGPALPKYPKANPYKIFADIPYLEF